MTPAPDGTDEGGPTASAADLAAGLARGYRVWLIAAGVFVAVVVGLLWGADRPDDPSLPTGANSDVTPATPADGLAFEERLQGIGDRCLLVLVADTQEERTAGLRGRESELARVDGMLFVFDPPAQAAFTMFGVVAPLSLGFYGEDGANVGAHDMQPCPGPVEQCPQYPAPQPFKFAVETALGKRPAGNLVDCSARTPL